MKASRSGRAVTIRQGAAGSSASMKLIVLSVVAFARLARVTI